SSTAAPTRRRPRPGTPRSARPRSAAGRCRSPSRGCPPSCCRRRCADMAAPEPVVRAGAQLGEGPVWDPAGNRLLWVDILGSKIHAYDPGSGDDVVLRTTPSHVGAVRPRRDGGLVVNLVDGIGLYDE